MRLTTFLLRLWKGYDSFRAESDVRTWIYRVALSVDIDPFEDMDDRALPTKRMLKSCDDTIQRLQMKEDDPQNN